MEYMQCTHGKKYREGDYDVVIIMIIIVHIYLFV